MQIIKTFTLLLVAELRFISNFLEFAISNFSQPSHRNFLALIIICLLASIPRRHDVKRCWLSQLCIWPIHVDLTFSFPTLICSVLSTTVYSLVETSQRVRRLKRWRWRLCDYGTFYIFHLPRPPEDNFLDQNGCGVQLASGSYTRWSHQISHAEEIRISEQGLDWRYRTYAYGSIFDQHLPGKISLGQCRGK